MENASKALLMAGGILIALLVIGAFMLMLREVAQFQTNSDDLKKQQQIAKFNNQYEPYNKDNVTVMELKSLYNKLKSNNQNNPQNEIKSNILNNSFKIDGSLTLNDFDRLSEDAKITLQFDCREIKYTSDGRICEINFVKIQ